MSQVPKQFQGFGVDSAENWNKPKLVKYDRPEIKPTDVVTENICCGLCGSDIHTIQANWGSLKRKDQVVGHEIVGKVIAVGSAVKEFKIGDRVGIGALSNSCGKCDRCKNNNEQHCKKIVPTYDAKDHFHDDYITQGGYSSHSIADERFVFAIPDELESEVVAPLFCGGLTVFSPLYRNLGENATGKTVGIIGIGGLGHMAIQFAAALGAEVYAFSRSSAKADQAKQMGATDLIPTGEDDKWTSKFQDKFDLIINCSSTLKDIKTDDYISVLKVGGSLVTVGVGHFSETIQVHPFTLISGGVKIGGSAVGSKNEVNLMLKLAAEKGVKPWIETIQIGEEGCHTALTRCEKGDIRYRFVYTGFDKAFKN
jgi:alcohol dehydrogenase (NADP+)